MLTWRIWTSCTQLSPAPFSRARLTRPIVQEMSPPTVLVQFAVMYTIIPDFSANLRDRPWPLHRLTGTFVAKAHQKHLLANGTTPLVSHYFLFEFHPTRHDDRDGSDEKKAHSELKK